MRSLFLLLILLSFVLVVNAATCKEYSDFNKCAPGQYCNADGTCADRDETIPTTWTCSEGFYNASDGCDCGCGAYDPDCAIRETTLFGCDQVGAYCTLEGECVNPSLSYVTFGTFSNTSDGGHLTMVFIGFALIGLAIYEMVT